VPNVLAMPAFQFGHPVLFVVLVESNNSLFHTVIKTLANLGARRVTL
jgi:hypothetical protein